MLFVKKNKWRHFKIFLFLFIVVSPTSCYSFAKLQETEKEASKGLSVKDFVSKYLAKKQISICYDELLSELNAFAYISKQRMQQDSFWVDNKAPCNALFEPSFFKITSDFCCTNTFIPFVEKFLINSPSDIALFGDLHADLGSLVDALVELKTQGFLNEEFNISGPNRYIIFLGDYVDHEDTSSEVLYILMKLYNQNPGKIWLIRGNHEDASRCIEFQKELNTKFNHVDENRRYKIFCAFDYMPLALFLGYSDKGLNNFIMFCHGGIEIGYSARDFLASDKSFQCINKLERSLGLDSLMLDGKYQNLKESAKSIEAILGNKDNEELQNALDKVEEEMPMAFGAGCLMSIVYFWIYELFYKKDFLDGLRNLLVDVDNMDGLSLNQLRFGLVWNSFGDLSDDVPGRKDLDVVWCAGILNWGEKSTNAYLSFNSSEKNILRSVIRGHQHVGKIVELLRETKGLYNLWEGKVFTLVSGAHLTPPECYNSFAILKITSDYRDWTMDHFYSSKGRPFTVETIKIFR